MTSESLHKLRAKCGLVYSPSAPVDRLQLFAGRTEQVKSIARAITTRGKHAIMYGEPGVGKTSLAMVMKEIFDDIDDVRVYKVNATEDDTFDSIWRRTVSQIRVIVESSPEAAAELAEYTIDQYADSERDITPGDINPLLARACDVNTSLVLVFDEFNRLNVECSSRFPDAIKDLSDNSVNATIVIVGVARDVGELIGNHTSIQRCLSQIPMEPMSNFELRDIIDRAAKQLGMQYDEDAIHLIVGLSQGFPHFTHLLAQEATYCAIDGHVASITSAHVEQGITSALNETDQTLRTDYTKAGDAQRGGTLYPIVVLACAMADTNPVGEFNSAAVRGPLRKLTGKDYNIR